MKKRYGLCCNLTLLCSSWRGISRISGLAYDAVVSIIQAAEKAQLVHNAEVQSVDTDAIAADELWSFVEKNTSSLSAG